MRHRSLKRAKQERLYSMMRVEFLAAHPRCEMRLADCTFTATEVHHRAGREGWRLLDQTRWTAGCSSCHRFVTEHPTEAYRLGLSEHRHGAA